MSPPTSSIATWPAQIASSRDRCADRLGPSPSGLRLASWAMQSRRKLGLTAVALVAVGLAGAPTGLDVLSDGSKLRLGIFFLALIIIGTVCWLADQVARQATSSNQMPTRQPLIRALEEHAKRLSDMLDARSAESPGPKGGIRELITKHRAAFEASAPAREEHDARTLAIYYEMFRSPGLLLFDEAVGPWRAGNPKMRPFVNGPASANDVRAVVKVFHGLVQNLREKATEKALEERGFVKRYVPIN